MWQIGNACEIPTPFCRNPAEVAAHWEYCYLALIAHKGLSFPTARNFDWQGASSKSSKHSQNQKLELLFRINHAALSDIRS